MMTAILAVQLVTYIALGALFLGNGQPALGVAQLLLAGVQALIFGPGLVR